MGLLYIAKILEKDGDEVTILDFSAESFDQQKLSKEVNKADIVGMSVLSYSLKESSNIINQIKK